MPTTQNQNLTLINDIASSCENKGIDTSNWFYTNEELEEMKKSPDYIFI